MVTSNIAKSATYIASYDIGLVVLSIIVASVASYTALNLAGRVAVAQGIARKLWLAGGAIAMGIGIWSMHFVAMLAYQLPISMTYNIPTVLASMVAAVLASGLALFLVRGQKLNWLQFLLGSIFMGLGIASMHYIGMAAMRLEAIAQYNPSLVGLSFAIAIGISGVALWLAFLLRAEDSLIGNVRKLGSAIVLGHAVAGMHYTGMAAVSFQPLPTNINFGVRAQSSQTMDNSLLAFEIGIATLVLLGLTVLTSLFNQRLSAENARAETLRQSEERFRSLVQNSSSVIVIIAADLTICYTSSSVQQILGYQPEEWFGTKACKYVHLDDLVKAENLLTAALNGSATPIIGEFRLRHVDNSWREFEVVANNLLTEPSVGGIVTTYRDITERKQAESALRQSEKKYRSVVDNVKEVIFQMDEAGAWTFLNPAWTEITGFSTDESIGQKFLNYVCPDDHQQALNLLQSLMECQKDHCQDEIRCLTKDGDYRWIEVYARATLNWTRNVIEISGTLSDITERQQVDRMKKEFISTVSHELRTPLTSILGSLGLVANGVAGEIPASAKAMIDIAYKNSERLVRLINDILDIEKIESGKMAFNLQPLELTPLVEQAILSNQAYGEQFRVKFILKNTLVGVQVNADSDRLMQVLTNLLSNAAKFSPPNETVIISVTRHNQAIRIAIADRGPGIPKDFRDRIFQKFAQADSSDTRQKGGTGLGLSISKAIVEKHGGQIGFATEMNVGTTFYFDLPEWYEPTITVVDHSSLQSHVLPILICEDDSDIANLLKLLLEQAGFKTDIAYSAAQAKQMLTQNQYAAMTLDIALPDVDGISLLRELRQQDLTRQLPIVVVSAKAELERQELNGNAITVIDWLNKPIDQVRLIAAVKQATQSIGSKPRILHIEDNPNVRQVVGAIVQNVSEICWAVNLQEAQHKLEQEVFDLIILDLSLPDGSGLDLLPQLNCQSERPIPVVVFSAEEVGRETVQDVAAVLIKSRISNQKLLEKVQALTKAKSRKFMKKL